MLAICPFVVKAEKPNVALVDVVVKDSPGQI